MTVLGGEVLDGFHLFIDAERERADIVLDRPPLNVISMPERDQLRRVFEALDKDTRVRIVVLRASGPHFSSGGQISGFLEASPEEVSRLAWNIAAPARCSNCAAGERPTSVARATRRCSVLTNSSWSRLASASAESKTSFIRGDSRRSPP